MPRKKTSSSPAIKEEPQVSNQETFSEDAELLSVAINQDTEALMRVADRLEKASVNFSQQQKGLKQMLRMQSDLKGVLSQIVGAMEDVTNAPAKEVERPIVVTKERLTPAPSLSPSPHDTKDDCGCSCIDSGCCCFEIRILKVRAFQAQLEPPDIGGLPGVHNPLEVRFAAMIENTGFVYPGLNTTISLQVGSLNPGAWVTIDRTIKKVCLKKGSTITKEIFIEATEYDGGAERPIGFKDEYGQKNASITLDCCMSEIHPPDRILLEFKHGGIGGGKKGKIQFTYYAKRVCC